MVLLMTIQFLEGKVKDSTGKMIYVTDRIYPSLNEVPHKYIKGIFFILEIK